MKLNKTRRGESLLFQGRIAENPQYSTPDETERERMAIKAYKHITRKHKLKDRAFVAEALIALREKLDKGYQPVTDTQSTLEAIVTQLGALTQATHALMQVANDIASGVIVAPDGYGEAIRQKVDVYHDVHSNLSALAEYATEEFEADDDDSW